MRGKISSISKRRSLRLNIPRHSGDNLPQMTHASGSCSFSLSVRHDVSDLYMSTGDLLLWRWRSLWQPWWHRCCESPPPCLGGARRRRAHARKRSCGDSLPMSSQSDLGADLTHNVPAACSVKNKRVGRLLISPHDRSSNHSQLGTDTLMNNEACRAMWIMESD